MQKKQMIVIVVCVLIGFGLIGGALVVAAQRKKLQDAPVESPHAVSQAELTAGDGKSGRPCLVAVDGTVYQIRGFSQWQNGEHANSNGQAYCGADMSKVIDQAPHGRSVLDLLIKVGPLQ